MKRSRAARGGNFRVVFCPNDCTRFLPLWNPGAEFNRLDVSGMIVDRSFPIGTLLYRRNDHTYWRVLDSALLQVDCNDQPAGAYFRLEESLHHRHGIRWIRSTLEAPPARSVLSAPV